MSSATRLNLTGIFTLYSDSTVVLIRAVLHLISCCCFCFSVLAHTPALALAFSLAPTLALAPAFALVFALGMMSGGFPKSAVLFKGGAQWGFQHCFVSAREGNVRNKAFHPSKAQQA